MSTVLLMTDSWQPTVLQLVPFSNNNAKTHEQLRLGRRFIPRRHQKPRGFPVLAVTRGKGSGRTDSRAVSSRSVTSARSEVTDKDNASVVSGSTVKGSSLSNMTVTSSSKYQDGMFPMKDLRLSDRAKGAQTPSDKESVRFSVQNINDQVSSSSSLLSGDASSETRIPGLKPKIPVLDNTRTKLPKPSLTASGDGRFMNISPVNGVRRSVPLTPGELDLLKFRENIAYNQEQIQRKKKFKLNVNQLPRSTTPINDHDPDKLNMKQVIAFLQTKVTKDQPQKPGVDRAPGASRESVRKNLELPSKHARQPVVTDEQRSSSKQSNVDSRASSRKAGTVSVMSTKSTPNFPYSGSHAKSRSSYSTKSCIDRSKSKRSGSYKPVKEFRLYRFLAVVPNGKNQSGLVTGMADTKDGEKNKPLDPGMSVLGSKTVRNQRRATRNTSTANLLHRRAVQKTLSSNSETGDSDKNALIRLPNVTDFVEDELEDGGSDDDSIESVASATYNSTHIGTEGSVKAQTPKKGRISFADEVQCAPAYQPDQSKTSSYPEISEMTSSVNVGQRSRTFRCPEFPRVNLPHESHKQTSIHVSVPFDDNRHSYSSEIVRLTLRHDKHATRVTSYMSDMQDHSNVDAEAGGDSDNVRPENGKSVLSMVSAQNYLSNKDDTTWAESPRQLIKTISSTASSHIHMKRLNPKLVDNE